jgi:hypothetical protein
MPRVRTLHDPVHRELSQAHLLNQLHAAGMASQAGWLTFRSQCQMLNTTDKPAPTPPRPRLVFPPNFRDVTAETIGTVIGIVGVTGAKATKPG